MIDLQTVVREIAAEMAARQDRGAVANYIPELARVDAGSFGMVVIDAEGKAHAAGDADTPFSIQSISKVFTLTLALGMVGDRLWRRVGREPSGNPFNSIVQLERECGVPRNPFINAGAIAVTDVILSGHQPREALGEILRFLQFVARGPDNPRRPGGGGVRKANRLSQHSIGKLHEVLRGDRQPRGFHARRLLPPLRDRHVLSSACDGGALSRPRRAQSGQWIVCRLARARATHQCANADLWPLRRFRRIRLSRRPAGKKRGRRRHIGGRSRPRRPSPSGRPGSTPTAIRIWAESRWKCSQSAWAGRFSGRTMPDTDLRAPKVQLTPSLALAKRLAHNRQRVSPGRLGLIKVRIRAT